MIKIRCTVDDLARTKVRTTQASTAESLFALHLLSSSGGGGLFAEWRRKVRSRLQLSTDCLHERITSLEATPELLFLALQHPGNIAAPADPGSTQEVGSALEEFHRIAIQPYWPAINQFLVSDCDTRGRLMSHGGVERMLAALHPQITWSSPVLELPDDTETEIRPNGRGLLLMPSLFLDRPRIAVSSQEVSAPVVVIYPAPLDPATAKILWKGSGPSSSALGPLVGRTRAAMLRMLNEPSNTTELGRKLRISAAAASQHTSVLRAAGLITTRRHLNAVLHTLTPLGAALLHGYDLTAKAQERPEAAKLACPSTGPPARQLTAAAPRSAEDMDI